MTKILFLPHCLKEAYKKEIRKFVEGINYEVYVVPGGSMLKNILKKHTPCSIEKLVGVACKDEVNLALQYLEDFGIKDKIVSITLTKEGCKNTTVDLETVFSKL